MTCIFSQIVAVDRSKADSSAARMSNLKPSAWIFAGNCRSVHRRADSFGQAHAHVSRLAIDSHSKVVSLKRAAQIQIDVAAHRIHRQRRNSGQLPVISRARAFPLLDSISTELNSGKSPDIEPLTFPLLNRSESHQVRDSSRPELILTAPLRDLTSRSASLTSSRSRSTAPLIDSIAMRKGHSAVERQIPGIAGFAAYLSTAG